MSAMAGIAAMVEADALLRPDPAAADRYAVFACHVHAFTVLSLDGWFHPQMQCRQRLHATAVCGAPAARVPGPVSAGDFPVSVVVARRGREVEWIKRRRGYGD